MELVPTTSPCNKSQGLVALCELAIFATVASSHDATSPSDLLQGLVAGTSPIVCADLYIKQLTSSLNVQTDSIRAKVFV